MSEQIICVEKLNIDAEVKGTTSSIVREISFSLKKGERLGIVGESGCGKTMIALSILGLLPANCHANGTVNFDGTNLLGLSQKQLCSLRGTQLVLIPQSGADFLNPVLKIKEQIFETLKKCGIRDKKLRLETARKLVEGVGFDNPEEVLEKYPFQLSGGMAQRIILAIGMASQPKLVIADEPTRGVDEETATMYMQQLDQVFCDSAVIIITHDISVAKSCDKLLVMYAGAVMEYGDTQTIIHNPTHPYTVSLINSLPANGFVLDKPAISYCRKFAPHGCPFHWRCSKADEQCRHHYPDLTQRDGVFRRCAHA